MENNQLDHQENSNQLIRSYEAKIHHMEDELRHQRDEFDKEKHQLYIKLKSVEQTFEFEKSLVPNTVDQLKRDHDGLVQQLKQEHQLEHLEWNKQLVDLNAKVRQSNLLMTSLNEKLVQSQQQNAELEKKIRELDWELVDTNRMTADRIQELEQVIREGDMQAEQDRVRFSEALQQCELDHHSKLMVSHLM